MSDVMPIEQAEFIDTLQSWFNQSTNMCHEDCYNLAFIIWQHKDYLSKMLGYEQGKADAIDEVTEKYFDATEDILHQTDLKLSINQAFSIYARIMNKFLEISEQLKEQNNVRGNN